MAKIISCKPIGKHQTFDLEVEHPDHQFYLSNGILTSNSHSMAYAFNSYHCAWLYTYFEEEWIQACLEQDPDLEKTINVVSQIGYTVNKPDVNKSLADRWFVKNKECVPALVAVKGIGDTAANELVSFRKEPFKDIYDFCYTTNSIGEREWRWGKFNRKAIEALIQVEAFESVGCVGADKIFKNYRHMHDVMINNFDLIKKGYIRIKADKEKKIKAQKLLLSLEELAEKSEAKEDWSSQEKIQLQKELMGIYDKTLILSQDVLNLFFKRDITPFTDIEEDFHLHWFILKDYTEKTTGSGKPYVSLKISDIEGNVKVLNYFGEKVPLQKESIYVACMKKDGHWLNVQYGKKLVKVK